MIIRPTQKLVILAILFGIAGILLGLVRIYFPSLDTSFKLTEVWLYGSIIFIVVNVYDLFNKPAISQLVAKRILPSSFALHRLQTIQFSIVNNSNENISLTFSDSCPAAFETNAFPMQQTIRSTSEGLFEYQVQPNARGDARLEPAYVQIYSTLGLWQFCTRMGEEQLARIYPDFSAIINSTVLGMEQNMRYIGAHMTRKKGGGMEFNQLREFRLGDTLKQIDWKATARLNTPISREYQEERDQNIIFLLDSSRRMRAIENKLSYFDHALNALLTCGYIALDKGDAVGLMTFSGEKSWLSPVKGKKNINRILNHLYSLTTSTQNSDYVGAAEELIQQQHKRSLIILLTNVRAEDNEDLFLAIELLKKHHLVLVAALQENILNTIHQQPI